MAKNTRKSGKITKNSLLLFFNYQTESNSNNGWTANYTIGGGNPNDQKYQEKFNKQQLEFLKSFENPIELKNACQ
ncbi:hypothetical protein [Chryseobacterium indoltheticum]|uniref:hypothetical protein n=1 Tax=Chryseobacterium indoltheticum TaxID=254 RepID=UPI003F49B378